MYMKSYIYIYIYLYKYIIIILYNNFTLLLCSTVINDYTLSIIRQAYAFKVM